MATLWQRSAYGLTTLAGTVRKLVEKPSSAPDAAHDVCHFRRVWATAQKLAADDDVDMLVILTACYFHDIVSLAKNHPQRQRSSILAAEETRRLLREEFEQFPAEKIEAVCHAIAAHSFSAQIAPLTTEAKIVQMRIGWKPRGDWPGARVCRFRGIGRGAV